MIKINIETLMNDFLILSSEIINLIFGCNECILLRANICKWQYQYPDIEVLKEESSFFLCQLRKMYKNKSMKFENTFFIYFFV